MRQEHDEDDKSKLNNGRRGVNQKTLFQVLQELSLEHEMKVRRLEANEGAQQIQSLYTVLLLNKETVKRNEEDLQVSVRVHL